MEVLQKTIDAPEASDMLMSLHCQTVDELDSKFEIEYDILPLIPVNGKLSELQQKIAQGLATTEEQKAVLTQQIDVINDKIDQLTNHADGIDYAIAVTCGLLTGLFDSLFVGEWNFENAKGITNQEINNKVVEYVKKDPRYVPWCQNTAHGRNPRDSNRLASAIEFLEGHYHLPGDGTYQNANVGIYGGSHRLDDFCHHPTVVGLICCVLVQFTGSTRYVNTAGEKISLPVAVNDYGNFVGKTPVAKLFSGVINWFFTIARTIANREGHLMSDIATSASIPGSFLSLAKELSSLNIFNDSSFSENLRKAYQNGIGTGKSQVDLGAFNALFDGASSKFDIKTEMAVKHELKRQALPIVVNEILVRSASFIRQFICEAKEKESVSQIVWKNVLPFNNRTITRMITIATGTFTAIDLGDAAIRSAVKSGGFGPAFASNFILRVTFVGIGRFAVAIGTDVSMGIKRNASINKRDLLMSELLQLSTVELQYRAANTWCAISMLHEAQAAMFRAQADLFQQMKKTDIAMFELYDCIAEVGNFYASSISYRLDLYKDAGANLAGAIAMNPKLASYF